MKKSITAVGAALLTVLAMGVVAAAAMADEWLANGAAIGAALAVSSPEALLELSDDTFGTAVDCMGTSEGTVGPGAKDETKVVSVKECKDITGCPTPVVKPVNLPWSTEIFLVAEVEFRDHIFNSGAGEPGYEITCGAGGFFEKETCTGLTSTKLTNEANGTVASEFEEKSEAGNCTFGGPGSGLVHGTVIIKANNGASLSVS